MSGTPNLPNISRKHHLYEYGEEASVRELVQTKSSITPSTGEPAIYHQLGDGRALRKDCGDGSLLAVQSQYDLQNCRQCESPQHSQVMHKKPCYDNSRNLPQGQPKYVTSRKYWLLFTLVFVFGIAVVIGVVLSLFSFIKQKYNYHLLQGHLPSTPAKSCAAMYQASSASPSDYYWIQSPNGSIFHPYCDLTTSMCGAKGWMRITPDISANNCPKEFCKILDSPSMCGLGGSDQCKKTLFFTYGIKYKHVCGSYNLNMNISNTALGHYLIKISHDEHHIIHSRKDYETYGCPNSTKCPDEFNQLNIGYECYTECFDTLLDHSADENIKMELL